MNILLTSVGRRAYLVDYFRSAIDGKGRVLATNSEYTYALSQADEWSLTPLIYSPDYIPYLVDFCRRHEVNALLPLFDVDLLVLAQHRTAFDAIGTRILLADVEKVMICNDKWQTGLMLKTLGLSGPKTCKTIAEADEALQAGNMTYPLIIKPRWGMASIGIYTAEDHDELTVFYQRACKDIQNSYLKFESALTPGEDVLIQEKLIGQEYGLDVLNDLNGQYVTHFAKQKVVMRAGETDVGLTVTGEPFRDIAEKLSAAIGHEAILSVDCFRCMDDVFVTELNCRISGHYPVSHIAGVDVPKQIVTWLLGGGTDYSLLNCEEGVTSIKDIVPRRLNRSFKEKENEDA